jgi:membrane peptidoglycan carboxypeptidase
MPARTSTARSAGLAVARTIGFLALAIVLVAVMAVPAIGAFALGQGQSPNAFEGLPASMQLGQQRQINEIYVRNADGSPRLIATAYDQNREEVTLDEMSDTLKWAAVAGEDRRFYEHNGVDPNSVARAVVGVITRDAGAGGASTLTMQTVRNILVLQAANDDQLTAAERQAAQDEALAPNAERKLREMKFAIGLEKKYSKDQILEGYLNIANFGRNTYGVQTAAEQYFGIPASEVDVAQAASLIATVQQPNILNLGDPENFAENQVRRDFIIRAMEQAGFIDAAQRDEALAIPVDENFVKITPPTQGCLAAAPEFRSYCDYVLKLVARGQIPALGSTPEESQRAWTRGGYQLIGSLDADLQTTAYQTVKQYADRSQATFDVGAAATTVEVGTGRVLTMAQNKDFDDSAEGGGETTTALNYSTDKAYGGSTGFQPGSTYKPFTLLAWLQDGRGVNEGFNVSKLDFRSTTFADRCNGDSTGDTIRNDEGERGYYSIVRGTARSVNSTFMQMASELDQCDIRDTARSIGVHRSDGAADGEDLQTLPSCVLGGCDNNVSPLTMAAAYAAIAGQGVYCSPIAIDDVIGPDGESLGGQDATCEQRLDPGVANAAAYAMQQVVQGGGTAGASNPGDGISYLGKTGTTQDAIHTWMVGSSTKAATAVWVGNATGKQSLRQASVAGSAASIVRHLIFRPLAIALDARLGGDDFPAPPENLLVGTPTTVPDVLGQTVDAARPIIENALLRVGDVTERDSEQPAGTIIEQNPGANASVTRGTPVGLVVSTGRAPQATAPDVVGQTFEAGRSAFQAAGFTGSITERCQAAPGTSLVPDPVDPGQPENPGDPGGPGEPEPEPEPEEPVEGLGTIVSQSPSAGSASAPDAAVTLTVLRESC